MLKEINLKKLLNKKMILTSVSVILVTALTITTILLISDTKNIPVQIQSGEILDTESDFNINSPSNAYDSKETNTEKMESLTSGTTKSKKIIPPSANGNIQTGTKDTLSGNHSVAVGTGTTGNNVPEKTAANPTGGVIGVTPVERGDEPSGPIGVTPQASDWVSINPDIPQELYSYDYTVVEEDILTGKQLEWRGFTDWDKAAAAAVGGLAQYFSIDYRNITSTDPDDRDPYLTGLVYWTGEAAHMDICTYIQKAIQNKITSTARVITDGSLIYNNGVRLIRARVYVTWQSGANYYGLKNGVEYYRDVEVAVYAWTGEDRYGFGECNDFNVLLFSNNCFNYLCPWKKA